MPVFYICGINILSVLEYMYVLTEYLRTGFKRVIIFSSMKKTVIKLTRTNSSTGKEINFF